MSTKAEINDRMQAFLQASQDIGFEAAAEEMEFHVRQTYPMTIDNVTFPIRDREGLTEYLKRAKKERVEGPFSSIGGYYLFTLDTIIPASLPPYESIESRVKATMEQKVLAEYVEDKLAAMYDLLTTNTPLEEIQARDTLIVFQVRDNVQLSWIQSALGNDVAGRVARMEPGEITLPVLTEWAGYIILCDDKRVVPMDSSMVYALQMKRQTRIEQVIGEIFDPVELEDNRDLFFE
jgi:hypothetical protein